MKTHAIAFAVVELAISGGEPPVSERDLYLAVRAWVLSTERCAQSLPTQEASLYLNVFRPWLDTLVGWRACSLSGRLAGSAGYMLLCEFWTQTWRQAWRELEAMT